MCNIAGYVGERRAAPILIDMMNRQSGFGGGFYTGIATIHEGKIHMRKVIGDVKHLLELTDAMDLPGTTGIIHSRSNSGGDGEWGHPFMSNDKKIALILNGHKGDLIELDGIASIAQRLLDLGVEFKTYRKGNVVENFPVLPCGTGVHITEVMTLLLAHHTKTSDSFEQAMDRAFAELPIEIVALILSEDYPDSIFLMRRNMPAMIGRGENEIFIATTAIAFPEGIDDSRIEPAPAEAILKIEKNTYEISSCTKMAMSVGGLDTAIFSKARASFLSEIEKKKGIPAPIMSLIPDIDEIIPKGTIKQKWMLAYEVVRPLLKDGTVTIVKKQEPGVFEGMYATRFLLKKTNL